MKISENELMKEFGENLDDILRDYRMSQKELADEIGVSKAMITYYIRGKRMPTLKTLVNIVNVLDCDVSDLVNFDYFVE